MPVLLAKKDGLAGENYVAKSYSFKSISMLLLT